MLKLSEYKNIIVGAIFSIVGILLIYYGYITLGISSIFIAILAYTFLEDEGLHLYLKANKNYSKIFKKISSIYVGNIIFIPPYKNLKSGGILIPKKKITSVNLGLFDEKTFITPIGLLISPPLGYELIEEYEDRGEVKLDECDLYLAISIVEGTLKSYNYLDNIELEEKDDKITLTIENLKGNYFILSPIVSSIIASIAFSTNNLLLTVDNKKEGFKYIITLKKLGHPDKFLW
ncbi:conserved hypothetical protein [Methanocaldococcus infernus ME]|uniref:Uncharacterized protein n=1 Tax=Methanocaldococcus infernus (strain DSM 11812 / JCM 15783 / ME) TaxID=573063 RepID=D5VTJ8_METIM|nr:conserved hypothetical protein [Methanocaldococcus infernus ME]